MAWTQANLDAIDTAILAAAQGKDVTFGDRSYTAQDLGDLRELRAEIARAVGAGTTTYAYRLAAHSKGV